MVLLVVDTQNVVVTPALFAFELFVENVKQVIEIARSSGTEVIFVQHDDGPGSELTEGTDGYAIYKEFAPRPYEIIFHKSVNSAFRDTGLVGYLEGKRETQVMILGAQTDYCIDATIKAGFEHHFEMIVPAYCNTTEDNEFLSGEASYHFYNERMWNGRYAKCISLEEAIHLLKDQQS